MVRVIRCVFLVGLVCAAATVSLADSGESDAYMWLQYGADGHPHARVIPSDRAECPPLTADGVGVTMTIAVVAAAGYDRVLCDASLPLTTQSVRVGTVALPRLPRRITRFVVLGDTGCRISRSEIQNCRDAQAWPFARIAQSIAREDPRPDLIVHVGDYQSRESPCPAGDARCAGSPYGDNWSAWAIDFFEPAAPLFATAPIIWVRGNHEDCARSGLGWSRYLAPDPQPGCRARDDPAGATFADLRLINVDTAATDEKNPDPTDFERDERAADAAADGRQTFLLTHRPPLAYLRAHAAADPNGPHLAAIIAGHLHLFAALSFAGAPPTIIVGTGGDELAPAAPPELQAVAGATVEPRFGYAVFDRLPGGWSISERDPDGAEHRRCVLRAHTIQC